MTTADRKSEHSLHVRESDVRHFCQKTSDRSTLLLSCGEPRGAEVGFVRVEGIEVRYFVRMQ
jgi:hypothetical protein